MKKKIYLVILCFVSMFLSSCVSDLVVDGNIKSSKIEITNGDNCIDITSDIDQHSFFNSITEKGFYFTRIIDNKEYTEKISISADKQLTYRIDKDLWVGLKGRVQSYFVEFGHEFQSPSQDFTINVHSTPSTVTGIRFEYDDASKITGKIYISGSNFGEYRSTIALASYTPKMGFAGKQSFEVESLTDSLVVFNYTFCNIASTDLLFVTPTLKTILPEKLVVDGCSIEVGDTTEYLGMPHKVTIYDGDQKVNSIGCLSNNIEMSTSNEYFNDNSTGAIITTGLGVQKEVFYFYHNLQKVYFPAVNFNILSAWEGIGNTTDLPNYDNLRFGLNRCWWITREDYGEYLILHSFTPATFTTKTYKIPCPDSNHAISKTYPCVCSDGVYILCKIDAVYEGYNTYWQLYKLNGNKNQIEKIVDPITNISNDVNYAFAKIGNKFLLANDYDKNILVYDYKSKTLDKYSSTSFYLYEYLGNDDQYAYRFYNDYDKSIIMRTSASTGKETTLPIDITSRMKLSDNSDYMSYRDHLSISYNRLYNTEFMCSCALPDLNDYKYYGIPSTSAGTNIRMYPVGDELYCANGNKFFKYIGPKK